MAKVTQPFANSFDDFVDDFSTTVVMQNFKDVFEPYKSKLESGERNAFNEALSSALMTLEMGLSMYVISVIQSQIMPFMLRRAMMLYSYIIGGKVVKSLMGRLKSRGVPVGLKKRVLNIVSDGLSDRQERAKIANDMVMHIDNMAMKHKAMATNTRNSINSTFLQANSSNTKSITLFTEKTKQGSWQNTKEDKRLYEMATGKQLVGISFARLVDELNKFSEFAVSAEKKVLNLAQVQLDTLAYNKIDRF